MSYKDTWVEVALDSDGKLSAVYICGGKPVKDGEYQKISLDIAEISPDARFKIEFSGRVGINHTTMTILTRKVHVYTV